MFGVIRKIRQFNLPLECQLDLFDKIVVPVLLHGCDKIVVPVLLHGCEMLGFGSLDIIERIHLKFLKGTHDVCFALQSGKEPLLLFTYLITLGKDVTFQLITKSKTNRSLIMSYLSVKRIEN